MENNYIFSLQDTMQHTSTLTKLTDANMVDDIAILLRPVQPSCGHDYPSCRKAAMANVVCVAPIATAVSQKQDEKYVMVDSRLRPGFPYDDRMKSHHGTSLLCHLKGKIIVVDGKIGAGKTTFCHILKKTLKSAGLNCLLYEEYINHTYLDLFLKNQKKYAFTYQTLMLAKRGECYKQALKEKELGKTIIIDRSLLGDMSFESLQHKSGNINHEEHAAYLSELSRVCAGADKPDLTVHLKVTTEVAQKRILARNRGIEVAAYDFAYHERLGMIYADILEDGKKNKNLRVHEISFDGDRTNFGRFDDPEYKQACVDEMTFICNDIVRKHFQ